MRRVKARSFGLISVYCGVAALGLSVLGERNSLVVAAALLSFAVMLVFAILGLFFALTEKPREIQIMEDRRSDSVIHVSGE